MGGGIAGGMSKFKGFDRRVWILFFAEIVSATGVSVVMPFLSIYFYTDLGVSMALIGVVYLFRGLFSAIGNTIGGELADRIGRKRVMYSALYARAGLFVLISIAVALTGSFLLIAVLVVIGVFCGSFVDPALNAMVADVVEPGRRVHAYSLIRVGVNVGWALGPFLGGMLASFFSYSLLFLVTAMSAFVFATVVFMLINESRGERETERFHPRNTLRVLTGNPVFAVFCIGTAMLFIVTSQMGSTLPAFSKTVLGLEEYQIGLVYMLNGLMIVFLQLPIASVIDRFRPSFMLIGAALMYTTGYALVGLAGGLLALMGCMVVITLGEVIMSPTTMNFVAKVAPEDRRGRYMGVFGLFSAGGWAMGPALGGLIMDAYVGVPLTMWSLIASMGLVSAGLFVLLGMRMVRSERSGGEPIPEGVGPRWRGRL